jgi:hypothetical protein
MILRCSLCGREWQGRQIKLGRHAKYRTPKGVKIECLICPGCLARGGLRSVDYSKDQLSLFAQKDSEPRDIKQAELTEAKTDLNEPQSTVSYTGNDCFYYMGAGNCAVHGDTMGCVDCDDYKSINDDDTEDDD